MRIRGNSHAGCSRRQRWIAIFNLSTLNLVGLQIVRGSVDIWMDMYCSQWEAVICQGKDLTIKKCFGRIAQRNFMQCLFCYGYLRLQSQGSPLPNPPRDALDCGTTSISEAAIQTLKTALARLSAQPTTAHGGDAALSQSAIAPYRPIRALTKCKDSRGSFPPFAAAAAALAGSSSIPKDYVREASV